MSYIGNQITTAFTSMDKQDITGNGGPNYTLSHAVANANEIEVFVNNVRQEPTVAYSASGTTLTMTGNVASSDDFYVVYQGKAVGTIVPPDGSVTSAKLDTNIAVAGDLTVDTDTLHVDSTNNRVGVGTTSPDNPLHVVGDSTFEHRTNVEFKIQDATDAGGGTRLSSIWKASGSDVEIGNFEIDLTNGTTGSENADIIFKTIGAGTLSEAMKIQSNGTILLGKADTTAATAGFLFNKNGNGFGTVAGGPVLYLNRTATVGVILQTRMNNSPVGSISVNSSSTAYNTSSDYRLKENVTDMTGATDRLKQLNPVRFNFIADADTTVDGFLAHEVQSVVPEAITGTHNEVDDDGNPEYQGIDQSKLVPLLVATIQEQQAAIEALTARVTALEAE